MPEVGYTGRMHVAWTAFAVILFVGLLAVHEAAHAVAMRGHGVKVEEAGIGLPFGPRLVLKPTRRRPFALSLSPLVVMAYVRADEEGLERIGSLRYRDRAWINGAGIVANLVTGAALAALLFASAHHWWRAAVAAAIAVAVMVWRRGFTAFVVPTLALPTVVVTGLLIVDSVGRPAGVVGTAVVLHVDSGLAALAATAAVSLGLALVNTMPFFPFDGARITGDVLRLWGGPRWERRFQLAGGFVALALMLYGIVSDVWWLLTR